MELTMHPVYFDAPNRRKRGRQPPAHGKPYECPWCYTDAKLRGTTLYCPREGCTWTLVLKAWAP